MNLATYHQLTAERRSVGLNSRGQPFQRTPNYASPEDRLTAARRRHLAAYHRRARRLLRAGLTTRGTPRKRQMSARDLIAARRLDETTRIRNWIAQRQAQLAVALDHGNYTAAARLLQLLGQALPHLCPSATPPRASRPAPRA